MMLNKAPSGQSERHQDLNATSSIPSINGKSTSSTLSGSGVKSLSTAKTEAKNNPIGQKKQKTGNRNRKDATSTPARTAYEE